MPVHQTITSLVSVIIPAYNAGRYIGETIESVLSQSYPELEIIVVDDGSTDDTGKIVSSFVEKESKVKLIRQENSGVAAARNTGIRHSQGEFIAPLDADDIWYSDKISCQVRLMRKNGPDVGIVYVWNARIDEDSNLIGSATKAQYEGDVFAELLISHFLGSASSPLIRRECIEKIGGYDTRFYIHYAQGCEDWDLHLRISEHYRFLVVKKFLVGYRQNPNAMSRDYKQMKSSRDLMFTHLRSRHQDIPNRLLSWSNSFYHLYLHKISNMEGDKFNSFNYLIKAGWLLPALFFCRDYLGLYKYFGIKAVEHWIPPSFLAMLRHRRYPKEAHKKLRLADLQEHAERYRQLQPRSIDYLRKRLIDISRKTLSRTMETSESG
jgi:glycosyltransferase involved in cell wall biosynthesis